MVHVSIWASGQVAKLSRDARLLYVGLITLGDDDGRLRGAPALIRSQILPYDDDVKVADVARWIGEIEAKKLIVRYEVEGEEFMLHPKWEDYQLLREDRRRDSNIPAPTLEFFPMSTKRQPNGDQMGAKPPHKVSKGKVREDNTDTRGQDIAFQEFWGEYPKKVGRKAAWKAWQRVEYTPELGARIMAALGAWKRSDQWTKDSSRFIPHAATWINGERWEDEVEARKARNSKYDGIGTKIQA